MLEKREIKLETFLHEDPKLNERYMNVLRARTKEEFKPGDVPSTDLTQAFNAALRKVGDLAKEGPLPKDAPERELIKEIFEHAKWYSKELSNQPVARMSATNAYRLLPRHLRLLGIEFKFERDK